MIDESNLNEETQESAETKPVFTFDDNYRPLFAETESQVVAPQTESVGSPDENGGQQVSAFAGVSVQEHVSADVPVAKEKKTVGVGSCIAISAVCTVIGCIIVAVVLLLLTGFFDGKKPLDDSSSLNSGVVQNGSDTTVSGTVVKPGSNVTINVDSDSLANAVYAKANQSVVGIRVVTSSSYAPWASETYTIVGEGSGIVYSSDGIIVTNYHVVEAALTEKGVLNSNYEIRVYLDTSLKTYSLAKLKGHDATTDLAVLKIDITGLTPLELADISKVEIGEDAFAIGSPGGLEFMNSISSGIVSGLNRNLQTEDGIAYDLIQTTAAINPGNSGGALLNSNGDLLGICVMKLVSTGYESMGFAISADTVKSIVNQILDTGKVTRAALGVTISNNYTATEAKQYNMPAGAWVYAVTDDSAADKAGVKSGDIIVGIDDTEITSFYELRSALLDHKPGDSVSVKVYRDGKYLTLTAILDAQ